MVIVINNNGCFRQIEVTRSTETMPVQRLLAQRKPAKMAQCIHVDSFMAVEEEEEAWNKYFLIRC